MSKITKKQLHNGWHCHDTEIIKMKKELRELKQSVLRLEKLTDEKLLDEPESQAKQLDQSVFDGLEENWRFAAVDGCTGRAYVYEQKPHFFHGKDYWRIHEGLQRIIGHDYDASNWQNSLIERDTAKEPLEVDLSSELTGSELCRAMLERGDKRIMCVSLSGYAMVITGFDGDKLVDSRGVKWGNAAPINNQDEPLTAAEAGL